MSRVSLIEQLYAKRKSALEFNFDSLWAPPIRCLLSQQDIDQLYHIATSLRYNGNINKKYELIDAVMRPRGFRRGNCGTNRVVYNFLEDPTFVAKIALDKVGLKDSPAEFKNQRFLQPFCCKIFEVDRTGVIAFVEKVNPITSLQEFASIADDVFNMMITKIIGKYVVDDLGTTKFMNYGLRQNANGCTFGPVVIDFPYVYELDGGKLICAKPIKDAFGVEHPCGGEIDYDAGLNNLYCSKCGRRYTAQELAKDESNVLIMYDDGNLKGVITKMRAQIVTKDGTVIKDSGRSSKTYISKDDYHGMNAITGVSTEPREVEKSVRKKNKPMRQLRKDYFNELHAQLYESIKDKERFNPVIDTTIATDAVSRRDRRSVTYGEYAIENDGHYDPALVTEAVDSSVYTTENPPEDIAQVDGMYDSKSDENHDSLNEVAEYIKENNITEEEEEPTDFYQYNSKYDPKITEDALKNATIGVDLAHGAVTEESIKAFDGHLADMVLQSTMVPKSVLNMPLGNTEQIKDELDMGAEKVSAPELVLKNITDSDEVTDLGPVEVPVEATDEEAEDISHQFGTDVAQFIMDNLKSNYANEEEPDYSKYVPEEESTDSYEEEEDEYTKQYGMYDEEDTSTRRRRRLDDDMSEY